ncbi:MAG: response regulator transcription factor [Geminicoccaceae bacterium]
MSIEQPTTVDPRFVASVDTRTRHGRPLALIFDDCPWRRLQLEHWLSENWGQEEFELVTIDHDVDVDHQISHDRQSVLFCGRSARACRQRAEEWITKGLGGIVPFDLELPLARKAVDFILAGGRFMPCDKRSGEPDAAATECHFTPREEEVAHVLVEGLPNKLIAHELDISEATVKVYVRAILRKLGCHNRTRAARILAQNEAA